jgi:hypothetical protein
MGAIELVGGTSRGIRLPAAALRQVNARRASQPLLPLPGIAQLALPPNGRPRPGSAESQRCAADRPRRRPRHRDAGAAAVAPYGRLLAK